MKARGTLSLLAVAAVFSILFVPGVAQAQYYSSSQVVDFIWVKTFGFKSQWLSQPNQIITQVILPSIAVYAIFLGLLRTLQVFRGMGNMEHVIAAVVMLSALFMGWIGWISAWMAVLGLWSVVIFIVLIFIGGSLYTAGFIKRTKHQQIDSLLTDYDKATKGIYRRIDNYDKMIADCDRKILKVGGPDTKEGRSIVAEKARWIAVRQGAMNDLRKLNEAFNTAAPVDVERKKS